MKNYEIYPIGSTPFPEMNATNYNHKVAKIVVPIKKCNWHMKKINIIVTASKHIGHIPVVRRDLLHNLYQALLKKMSKSQK